ncbi:MAG TPA: FecR domain-containing protein [Steroidobacteraceae bacterium]|nr:FecR domain-containing protein [Steroidobacteraceae bacterium]HXS30812.1 FecR domain-containing protein [Steroidobacteraceae bacterium]
MTNLTEFPDLGLAREQAAEWIARLSRGLDAAEQTELRRWRASPANERALQQLSALWNELDVLKTLASVFPEPPAPAMRVRNHRPAAIAAGIVLCLVLAGGLALQRYLSASAPAAAVATRQQATDYSTAVGEQRNVPLPDGSTLAINTASLVQVVSLGQDSRELRLVQGEAHFTVARDPKRPFRVNAAGHIVQAVGTAFDVRLPADGGLEVIVTDGHVKLLSDSATVGDLARGQAMRIAADGSTRVSRLDDTALAARLAWRSGMLVFDGQTLAAALDEFSRYTSTRFVIADPQLGNMRIGGYFPAGDTAALLDALRANFGIESTRNADGVVRIGPKRTHPGDG